MKLLKNTLTSAAALALVVAPVAVVASAPAPAAAADAVSVSNVQVTNETATAWSTVTVSADWSATSPTAGQTFTLSLGEGLRWSAGVAFPLTEKSTGEPVGSCVAAEGSSDLVCTLNANAEKWDTLEGGATAWGQITDALVGRTSSTLTASGRTYTVVPGDGDGDGVCDVNCDGVTPKVPDGTTEKYGWFEKKLADGTNEFEWAINVTGSTSYTVSDPGTTVAAVSCTDGSWDDAYSPSPAAVIGDDTASFTAPSTTTVCRVTVTSTTTADTATNTATVNGATLTADARATAQGEGWATGANAPVSTPTPSETPTGTPSATPSSAPSATTSTTPSATASASSTPSAPTTPAACASTSPSASASASESAPASPSSSATGTPGTSASTGATPSATRCATAPAAYGTTTTTPSTSSATGRSLARTGADAVLGLAAVVALGAGASTLAVTHRRA